MSQISLSNTWKMDAKCKAEQSEKKVACELKISETRIPSRSFPKKYEEVGKSCGLWSDVGTRQADRTAAPLGSSEYHVSTVWSRQ